MEVLGTEPDLLPPGRPVTELDSHGRLQLRAAEFRYPGAEQPVLSGISLDARPVRSPRSSAAPAAGRPRC